jgi:hypothetical protein
MSIAEQASPHVAQLQQKTWIGANWGLLLEAVVLLFILFLSTPADLSVAGHRMLAVFGFAVIVWKYGRYWLHPEASGTGRYLAELADCSSTVLVPALDRPLWHHDADDAAGNEGDSWRRGSGQEIAQRTRSDDRARSPSLGNLSYSAVLLDNQRGAASVR